MKLNPLSSTEVINQSTGQQNFCEFDYRTNQTQSIKLIEHNQIEFNWVWKSYSVKLNLMEFGNRPKSNEVNSVSLTTVLNSVTERNLTLLQLHVNRHKE